MSLPTTNFAVDGRTYTTTLLPATQALVLMPKLIALFGKELTSLLLAAKDANIEALLDDPETLGAVVTTIAKNAAENNGLLLLHELMRHTTTKIVLAGGSQVEASVFDNFDTHFAGDYLHLINVAVQVARASFIKPSAA
jgi:hypothetical protein